MHVLTVTHPIARELPRRRADEVGEAADRKRKDVPITSADRDVASGREVVTLPGSEVERLRGSLRGGLERLRCEVTGDAFEIVRRPQRRRSAGDERETNALDIEESALTLDPARYPTLRRVFKRDRYQPRSASTRRQCGENDAERPDVRARVGGARIRVFARRREARLPCMDPARDLGCVHDVRLRAA